MDFALHYQTDQSKIFWIMVRQRNRRIIYFQSAFFGSFVALWSERSRVDLSSKETQNPFFGFFRILSDWRIQSWISLKISFTVKKLGTRETKTFVNANPAYYCNWAYKLITCFINISIVDLMNNVVVLWIIVYVLVRAAQEFTVTGTNVLDKGIRRGIQCLWRASR